MPDPSLLILIPAYNEEARIAPMLRDYAAFFEKNYSGKFQIVVLLNGCTDNTLAVVRRVNAEFPAVRVLEFREAIGKGGALIEGLKLAPLADVVGYVDADGASSPRAFYELVKRMNEADCVIGSRWLPDSVLLQAQPGFRQFISRCFHLIVEALFWMHIKDTQCPCKVMRRTAVEKTHSSLLIADLAFDVNLLVCMKRAGFKILEVPTEWTDKVGSKVTASLFRSSLTMFLSVVRVRLIYSPFYRWLRPLRPLESWIYKKLRAPRPLSSRTTCADPSYSYLSAEEGAAYQLTLSDVTSGATIYHTAGSTSSTPPSGGSWGTAYSGPFNVAASGSESVYIWIQARKSGLTSSNVIQIILPPGK